MGSAGKTRRHAIKMRLRRAAKAAKQVAYLALRGTSKKNKKIRAKGRGGIDHKHLHLIENCGNVGCSSCFPQFSLPKRNGSGLPAIKSRFRHYLAKAGLG